MKSNISRVGIRSGAVVLVTLLASPVAASVIVSLNNPGSTTLHEVWVEPGETFIADLSFGVRSAIAQASLALRASLSDVFAVTSITDASPWSASGPNALVGGLNPESGKWTTVHPEPAFFGPGMTSPGQIQVTTTADATPGTYTIEVDGQYFGLPWIEPSTLAPGPALTIHVIPEPGGSFLALIAMGAILRRPTARQPA